MAVQRRLAAILAADVAGYSRLMGEDEEGTLATLTAHLTELIEPCIAEHRGRVVKTTGDGLLAEFASVVDAVRCAVAFQEGMAGRNADTSKDQRIEFRIGVNLGDVIVQDDDVYGDGVNVAARLEGLAEPGAVVVSGKVHEEVRSKVDFGFVDLGVQEFKNIAEPIHAFSLEVAKAVISTGEPQTPNLLPVPDKPSIAVLPFQNMSGDLEQEYFANGIAEDIITALSRFHWFFVIARNSSFSYKGTSPDVRDVAKELGVQYVLEGSVRKGGNRLRITAQLVDALTGRHVWAERYDRDLHDIFVLQDEITEAIVAAVAPSFVSAEARRAERKPPDSFDAWDHVMRGNWHLWRLAEEDVGKARREFQSAMELDPHSAIAHGGFSTATIMESFYGWARDPHAALEVAHQAALRAIDLDDNDASAHCALALIRFWTKQHDAAIKSCERALSLNPNLALAEAVLGGIFSWTGDYDLAIEHVDRSERLSPRDPAHSLWGISRATAEFCAAHYDEAVASAKRAVEAAPNHPSAWRMLAASLAQLGREDEARKAVERLLLLLPGLTVERCRQTVPAKQTVHLETYMDGLRKAGLPE